MKAILHMGMPKTGSSSIQESLWQRKGSDFYYLDWQVASHNPLLMLLFEDNQPADKHAEWMERTTMTLAAKPADTVIFSAERLFNVRREVKERVRDFFATYCDDIKVVGYVRPPVSYLQSAFQQNLKTGHTELRLGKLWPHYQRKINDMDELFGRDNVVLRKFDRDSLEGQDVVRDFCSTIGMPLKDDEIVQSNESMSLEAAALLFTYRRMLDAGPDAPRDLTERGFVAALSSIEGTKLRFAQELAEPVLTRFKEDLDWIEDRLGQPLRDTGTPYADGVIRNQGDLLKAASGGQNALKDLIAKAANKLGNERRDIEAALGVMRAFSS